MPQLRYQSGNKQSDTLSVVHEEEKEVTIKNLALKNDETYLNMEGMKVSEIIWELYQINSMDAQTDSKKDSGSKKPAWEMVGLRCDKEYKAFKDSKAKAEKSCAYSA